MEVQLLTNNISKNILKDDLKFLVDNIKHNGCLDFRLLPFQNLNKKDFNNIYQRKLSRNPERHIDIIGAYHVVKVNDDELIKNNSVTRKLSNMKMKSYQNLGLDHSDEAHIIYKLDNGYWFYTHLYADYIGLVPYGVHDMISYVSKDLNELITYGIDWKYLKLLGIVAY